jgi:hypothetical protein
MNHNIEIITVDKEHCDFFNYCDIIESIADSLPSDMKRINNYKSNLKIRNSIAVSLYRLDSKVIGFSSVLHRDLFGNGVRILNRLVKTVDYRFPNGKRKLTPETKLMIDQQIAVAKKFNFDYVFISRESNKDVSSLRHYLKSLPEWQYPDNRYRVCTGRKQCDQYIAWFPLTKNITLPLIELSTK